MPKPQGNAPIFRENFGGVSVSAWQFSAVIQKRKPDDPKNPKGSWHTEAEIKGLSKKQCAELGRLLIEASKKMSEREYDNGKSNKGKNDEDDE